MKPEQRQLIEAFLRERKTLNDRLNETGRGSVLKIDDAIRALLADYDAIVGDPLSEGWMRAEEARRDRAAAVSQWKAALARANVAEKDKNRYRFLRDHQEWGSVVVDAIWSDETSARGEMIDAAIDDAMSRVAQLEDW